MLTLGDYHLLGILKQHAGFHSIKLKTALSLHYV